jgi:anti-anti-sigma regulatory factor
MKIVLASANKGKLVLHGLSDEILDVLKLTKLNKLLPIADSKDAAAKKAAS